MRVRVIDRDGTVRQIDAPYPSEPWLSLAKFEPTYGKVSGIWRIAWYRRIEQSCEIMVPVYEWRFTNEYDHYEL